MLAACAGSMCPPPAAAPKPPALPAPPPFFGVPVTIGPAQAGEDGLVYAAKEKMARVKANTRLQADAAFYADVVRFYGPH